ncbi:MAG TPA: ester cyclase [Vitreimonas sp.]|uniref:ester cyclase n=1 Tax=Vitreimonas sp. TaxID=3069702 RepID=UPI002D356AB8|nr:ester cyclase [Vitreimonas sp.]HYD89246.1 ester cyclase [Vitreimonas sp.]
MSTAAENKRRYERFVDRVVNAKDYDVADEIIAADVVSHDPFPGQKPGPAGVKDTFRQFHAAFPDLRAEIANLIAEDDNVACHLVVTGTHTGEFMGHEPTGNPIRFEEVLVLRFEDGKVVEHWAVADVLGLMQAIGAVRMN